MLSFCYYVVSWQTADRLYDNVGDTPEHEYGLLLGTSPITPGGAHNFYFDNRIKSTIELYQVGKIKRIIASGGDYTNDADNRYGCDELKAMLDSLAVHGIPSEAVILDYDGIRTLNSIVKAKNVYRVDSIIIISQKYHNERAIWQSDHYGLYAVGYNAAPSHIRRKRIKI